MLLLVLCFSVVKWNCSLLILVSLTEDEAFGFFRKKKKKKRHVVFLAGVY